MSELTWLSTRELAAEIAAGRISAREALADHLARIDEVNPAINAIVTLDAEAAEQAAAAADDAHARGESLGLLHGVPMTHKDTHDTAGMRSTHGSPLWADRVPADDSVIIARLRAAGVISTGKSNVPEFAAGSHTFNPVFGTTVNPYDTTKSASGSSGGVGAALAAGIQASGDGSDMGGSLRTPGSFNNVVGFRPSHGRIPKLAPDNPHAWLGQSGFMARTVSDVALLMQAGCGPATGAPWEVGEPGSVFDLPEFRLGTVYQPELSGIRVGFSPDFGGQIPVEAEVAEIVAAAAEVFAGLGAEVAEDVPNLEDADEVFRTQRAYDFAMVFEEMVEAGGRDQMKKSLVDNIDAGLALTAADVRSKDAARVRLGAELWKYFETRDVFVTTTSQVLPFDAELEYPTEINGEPMADYLSWMRAATLISATGCPAVSVPAGFSESGLPVGIQIVAAPGRDLDLLRIAHAFEAVTEHHLRHPEL